MTNSKLRAILYVTAAAAVLTGCGADDVASPGEGNVVIITPPSAPPPPPAPTPTPTPTPTSPTSGPAASCPSGTTNIGLVGPNDQARGCQLPNQINGTYNVQNLAGVVYAFSGRVEVGRDVGGDGDAPRPGEARGGARAVGGALRAGAGEGGDDGGGGDNLADEITNPIRHVDDRAVGGDGDAIRPIEARGSPRAVGAALGIPSESGHIAPEALRSGEAQLLHDDDECDDPV